MDTWDYEPDEPEVAHITLNGPVEATISFSPEPYELEPGRYEVCAVKLEGGSGALALVTEDDPDDCVFFAWVSEDLLDVTVCRDHGFTNCGACPMPQPCEGKGWVSNELLAEIEESQRS